MTALSSRTHPQGHTRRRAQPVPSFEEITRELMTALGQEIEAVKEEPRGTQVGLREGCRSGQLTNRRLYVFSAESELSLPPESPGQLWVTARLTKWSW